jgi:hypothetical protein
MSGVDTAETALGAEFPGWHVWRSDRGRWWAVRVGGHGGTTLDADDETELRGRLTDAAERDRQRAA